MNSVAEILKRKYTGNEKQDSAVLHQLNRISLLHHKPTGGPEIEGGASVYTTKDRSEPHIEIRLAWTKAALMSDSETAALASDDEVSAPLNGYQAPGCSGGCEWLSL